MTDNDWIKQLQAMMDRHQEPVPDDLWQDIEKHLPGQQTRRRPMTAWLRYAAAAALVLAVIGIGTLLWHNDNTLEGPATSSTETAGITHEPEITHELLAQNEEADCEIDEPATTTRASQLAAALKSSPTADDRNVIAQTADNEQKEQTVQEISETTPVEPPTEQARQPIERRNGSHVKESPTTNVPHQSILPKFKKAGITVGLYASNSVKPNWPSSKDYAYEYEAIGYPKADYSDDIYYSEDIYSANHHAPMSMGLSVRLPLTNRLALTSGLVYTRLKSDFNSSRKHREQTLHYLGIPLGATYTIWGYKRFSIYAVGGVQADFNVKATLKESTQTNTLSIGKDRVQFSALIGPGIQLDLVHGLGIYVEPTARYYFNNGSDVANYYKEHQWNINFNGGLRFTLE